jgi:hypothetical protein
MKRYVFLLAMAMVVSVGVLSGCGSSTDSVSSETSALETSLTAAEAVLASTQADMQTADSLRHGPCGAMGFPLRIPDGCPWDDASGSFVCGPDVGPDGLTRTRSYQFLDASGSSQSAYDSLTTASIRFGSTVTGTTSRFDRTSVIDNERELVVSGLEGSETTRTWNGAGSSSRRDSSAAGVVSIQSTTVVSNVVIPAPWARASWPRSGTIATQRVSSDGTDRTSVITFNGTRYATLTVDGVSTTIDLARGRLGGAHAGDPHGRHRHGGRRG